MKANKQERSQGCSIAAIRYAQVLLELEMSQDIISDSMQIFQETMGLANVLGNPVVDKERKYRVIDRVFPKEIRNFLKVVMAYGKMAHIEEIFRAYEVKKNAMAHMVPAVLTYVTPPSKEQLEQMEHFLCGEFGAKKVQWNMQERPELIGGFVLDACGKEYDYSVLGQLTQLEQKLTWR